MTRLVRLAIVFWSVASAASAQTVEFTWANFPVERQAFAAGEAGRYAVTSTFDGIGNMYVSAERKQITFRGLRRIHAPYLHQQADDQYEFRFEQYTLTSIIRIGPREYAFQGVNQGPFDRNVTGRIRFSDERLGASVLEFTMDEHGQELSGVMNQLTLPKSEVAKAMLKRYDEVFFGGNYVALEPNK